MKEPVTIQLKMIELTLEGVKQFFVALDKEEWKFETLIDLHMDLQDSFSTKNLPKSCQLIIYDISRNNTVSDLLQIKQKS